MKYLIAISVIFLILFLVQINALRFAKTLYLIAKISPYEQSAATDKKILILGDSTGYGTGATINSNSIAGLIGKDFSDYSIRNISVNGRTIEGLLTVTEEIDGYYDLILIQIGANDILKKRLLSDSENDLRIVINNLENHTANLVMISSGNVGGASVFSGNKAVAYTELTRKFREMFIRVGQDTSLNYVDLFLEPEEDVIANNPKVYLAIDGLHPSDAGYAVWYQTLKPILVEKLLSSPE